MNTIVPFISKRSFTILVIFFMIGTSILITPNALAQNAKQDAWVACILGVCVDLLLVWLYVWLGRRHPDRTIVGCCEELLGPWIGKIPGLLFALFCYFLAALMVGDLGYFCTTQTMVDTPIEILQLLFVSTVVIAVLSGVGAYVRAADIFFPWFLLLLVLLVAALAPKFEIGRLQPVMETGIGSLAKGAFSFFSLQEIVVLMMLYPYVRRGKGRGRAFLTGTMIGGLVLVVTTIGSIGVLDSIQVANNQFPTYIMAKNISIGNFMQRMEGLLMLIWVLSIFMKVTVTFHASVLGMAQLFRVEERALVWPLAIGLVVIALMCYTNVVYVQNFLATLWTPFASLFIIVLPLLLLAASLIREQVGPVKPKRRRRVET